MQSPQVLFPYFTFPFTPTQIQPVIKVSDETLSLVKKIVFQKVI